MKITASEISIGGIGKDKPPITARIDPTNTTQTDIQLIDNAIIMREGESGNIKGFPFFMLHPISFLIPNVQTVWGMKKINAVGVGRFDTSFLLTPAAHNQR